tara:strand:- start:755 stop:1120 length:366 start_codon:yes stop_codon:yes gene_type:complete
MKKKIEKIITRTLCLVGYWIPYEPITDEEGQNDFLSRITDLHTGIHYQSPRLKKLFEEEWQDYWPIVNSDGHLTGDITEGGEEGDLLVMDDAIINIDDLTDEQIEKNGGYENLLEDGYVLL